MKKPPSKVAHNRPPTFFMYWPSYIAGPVHIYSCQTAQEQKSRTTKSTLMQGWVLRLGIFLSS